MLKSADANQDDPILVTWESEIRALAAEAVAWPTETGGDLFGLWADPPVIYLVTRAGPAAVRDVTHFRLDVGYLRVLSQQLATGWGLRYLGDWHSHHRLGLTAPSAGDQRRIKQVSARNAFPAMAEIIVTLEDGRAGADKVRLHPWVYTNGKMSQPVPAKLEILSGLSPVRDALIVREMYPEQELHRWGEVTVERVVGSIGQRGEGHDKSAGPHAPVVDRLIDDASRALEEACGKPIEQHTIQFGTILAVPIDGTRLIAFAVSREWPCPVLEADWIDRNRGTAEPIPLSLPTSLRNPAEIVTHYRTAQQLKVSEVPVDVDHIAN
jgi:hypothetical protein